MATREIINMSQELYGAEILATLISNVAKAVIHQVID
jgi:transposase-like protein